MSARAERRGVGVVCGDDGRAPERAVVVERSADPIGARTWRAAIGSRTCFSFAATGR